MKKCFILVLITFVLAGCDGSNTEVDTVEASEDTTELDGRVVVDGSGTVFPLMALFAEEYMTNERHKVSVEVSRTGTSAGFKRFLSEKGSDFNNASRKMKKEEATAARKLGLKVKELKIALDGLVVVVHPENDFADVLTPEEIVGIFLGKYATWADLYTNWPDEKINKYGPNENHGTYEFFYENILKGQDLSQDVHLQQQYAQLVTLISQDKNSIGFFGFGYYVNNQDSVQAVSIDFGAGPVKPDLNTIGEQGDYADFTRPVYTYLNMNHAKEKPQVLDFAIFIMENVRDFAADAGFAPIATEEADMLVEKLEGLEEEERAASCPF